MHMRIQIQTSFAIIGALSMVLFLSACPKKVETTKGTAAMTEEKVAPPPEPMQPEVTPAPPVEETPIGREAPSMAAELADIHFDFDKYNIRDDARSTLEGNGQWMKANAGKHVTIEGNCDERGTNEYNLALGERRAQAAKRYLTALGIEAGRISTISYGEERPLCSTKDESCYAQNRRDHFAAK
jgi:peptidoglycan-associated lipoprotein